MRRYVGIKKLSCKTKWSEQDDVGKEKEETEFGLEEGDMEDSKKYMWIDEGIGKCIS